jgi:HD-GYP domain-containing protein (c-di-GMP phosphodiesterase class II)
MMELTKKELGNYFEIRINSVAPSRPLTFDIYLYVNRKSILFRQRGEAITPDRIKALYEHGGDKFLVPNDQKAVYLKSLRDVVHDPNSPTELKAKFIKETAFIHVHDLFTKGDILPVVNEAQTLVEEMVSFVSTDVNAVTSLMRLSVHDYYTYNHCVDVAVYSVVLAKKIFGGDKQLLLRAGLGGLLHDIGKRKIDLSIINKTSSLTPDEWAEIKRHPTYGKQYLEEVPMIPEATRLVVYEHHENFDGTGYPRGLREEEISRLARVVTIADVFDALTTNRTYHKAITPEEALNTMYGMQPGKFDPGIFKSFNKNFALKSNLLLPKDFDPCKTPAKIRKAG